jgi:HAD superfamily hydrolase (TIGR01509 family)
LVAALDAATHDPEIRSGQEEIDCSAERHRELSLAWFTAAGLDDPLAETLYALDFEPASHPFFSDVATTLRRLHEMGVAIGVVSDIHFDLRPEFAAAHLDEFVDSYVLSFEHGVQKPSEAIFRIASASLDLEPEDLLMVGDRASHDGGAVAVGMPTLLLPPLQTTDVPRGLHAVIVLVESSLRPA